jgi:hypothetical protein
MLLALTPLMPHQIKNVLPLVMGSAMREASNWLILRSFRVLSNLPLIPNMAIFFLYLPANLLAQLLLPPTNSHHFPTVDLILLLRSVVFGEMPDLSSDAEVFSRRLSSLPAVPLSPSPSVLATGPQTLLLL